MNKKQIESEFPNLQDSAYKLASPETIEYNCIAWAAGETDVWWWPDSMNTMYWPHGVQRTITLNAFVEAFQTLSYTTCDSAEHEEGYEKIAIYTNAEGKPTHAARQLASGLWTSKLGKSFDIEHPLEGVSDSLYGRVAVVMKRRS